MFAPDLFVGKVAVVTGAGTGIGTGIAEAFANAGAAVTVAYYGSETGAEALVAKLTAAGKQAIAQRCDVRDHEQVQVLFDATIAAFARVDILVNNSGITDEQSLLEMTPEAWDKTLNINLRGTLFCTQRAAKEMIAQGGGGKIINLSSVHGFQSVPGYAHYEASKGGINMFTKAAAVDLARHDIQVNAIAPGAIEVERYFRTMPDYDRGRMASKIPAGRVGFPDDIAPLALFLASPGADYITGQIIWADGGLISAGAWGVH